MPAPSRPPSPALPASPTPPRRRKPRTRWARPSERNAPWIPASPASATGNRWPRSHRAPRRPSLPPSPTHRVAPLDRSPDDPRRDAAAARASGASSVGQGVGRRRASSIAVRLGPSPRWPQDMHGPRIGSAPSAVAAAQLTVRETPRTTNAEGCSMPRLARSVGFARSSRLRGRDRRPWQPSATLVAWVAIDHVKPAQPLPAETARRTAPRPFPTTPPPDRTPMARPRWQASIAPRLPSSTSSRAPPRAVPPGAIGPWRRPQPAAPEAWRWPRGRRPISRTVGLTGLGATSRVREAAIAGRAGGDVVHRASASVPIPPRPGRGLAAGPAFGGRPPSGRGLRGHADLVENSWPRRLARRRVGRTVGSPSRLGPVHPSPPAHGSSLPSLTINLHILALTFLSYFSLQAVDSSRIEQRAAMPSRGSVARRGALAAAIALLGRRPVASDRLTAAE